MYLRSIEDLANHMNATHKKPEVSKVTCTQCKKELSSDTQLKQHMKEDHITYKPCSRFGANKCTTSECRFKHVKLQPNQEICFKCGDMFSSKTSLLNHIKVKHGHEICHRFLRNECDRSSDNCIFSHKYKESHQNLQLNKMQDFPNPPTLPLHSPIVGVPTMSEHLQNQQKPQNPQGIMNIMNMIPQIVSQVIEALTIQMKLNC